MFAFLVGVSQQQRHMSKNCTQLALVGTGWNRYYGSALKKRGVAMECPNWHENGGCSPHPDMPYNTKHHGATALLFWGLVLITWFYDTHGQSRTTQSRIFNASALNHVLDDQSHWVAHGWSWPTAVHNGSWLTNYQKFALSHNNRSTQTFKHQVLKITFSSNAG